MIPITVEACIDSVASLHAAVSGGADRIELCSALELGGLTPTASLIRAAARAGVPACAMIRPRAGDFSFTDDDIKAMTDDICVCAEAGLAGIVIGAAVDGELDLPAMERLMAVRGTLETTLHRVFDTLNDPSRAIDQAIELGIERILTSGGAATAEAGVANIRHYVNLADGRLSIMAGGGIRPDNVAAIVARTGVSEVHGTFSARQRPFDTAIRDFGFGGGELRTTRAETIVKIKETLRAG